jgi:hypothetical protein
VKRAPGKRPIYRSPQRPLPAERDSPVGRLLAQCLARIEVSLAKWPPEYDAAHAAIDQFAAQCGEIARPADVLALPLHQSGLSVRTANLLEAEGIGTVGELLAWRREDLQRLPRIARKTVQEIYLTLQRLGFQIPPPEALGMA